MRNLPSNGGDGINTETVKQNSALNSGTFYGINRNPRKKTSLKRFHRGLEGCLDWDRHERREDCGEITMKAQR